MPSLTITRYTVRLFSSRPSAKGPVIATIQFCAAPPDAEPPPRLRRLPCTGIPGAQHRRYPYDRALIAQALVEGLTLVTHNAEIQKYEVAFRVV